MPNGFSHPIGRILVAMLVAGALGVGSESRADDDDDNDAELDGADNCQFVPNADQADRYGSRKDDACENDSNGDGIRQLAETYFQRLDLRGDLRALAGCLVGLQGGLVGPALRLGFRLVRSLGESSVVKLSEARDERVERLLLRSPPASLVHEAGVAHRHLVL